MQVAVFLTLSAVLSQNNKMDQNHKYMLENQQTGNDHDDVAKAVTIVRTLLRINTGNSK